VVRNLLVPEVWPSTSPGFEEKRCAVKSLSWEKVIGSRGPVIAGCPSAPEARSIVERKAAQRVVRY
jgi:hypothetical protein